MGADSDDQKNVKRTRKAKPQTVLATDAFFADVIKTFKEMTDDHDVLLNVPIWGYPGHGKTSSLLTVIHYCRAHVHGASLALVTDGADLAPLAKRYPQYAAGDLRVIADTTRQFLGDLGARFFGECEWPDATEQPAQYLLELQTLSGTLGYVILPDIRGGSYEEADEISKNALANAHAMVVVVMPNEYVDEENPRTADYRKEVLRRIQRCAHDKIPTCVVITMADAFGKTGDAADQTEKELTRLLEGQASGFSQISKLMRVSVIGSVTGKPVGANGGPKPPPPPAKDRRPDALLEAWIWTLKQALASPRDAMRQQAPHINLRQEPAVEKMAAPAVAALRPIASAQPSPGTVLCALNETDATVDLFLFRAPDGKLFEVRFQRDSPKPDVARELTTDVPVEPNYVFQTVGSTVMAGPAAGAVSLLCGVRGQGLTKTSLPIALQSWAAIDAKRVVGISAEGTIHSLFLRGGTWEDIDHVANFFAPADRAVCAYLQESRMATVATGAEVFGVDIVAGTGRFGDVRKPAIGAKFDGDFCVLNQDGYFLARMADQTLVAGREKQVSLGAAHPEWASALAICPDHPLVAWAAPAGRVRAATVGKKVVATADEFSAVLPAAPTGLAWNARGDILIATLADQSLLSIGRFGF